MRVWKTSKLAHFRPDVITINESDLTVETKNILSKIDTIPLGSISSVSLEPGLAFSTVKVKTNGGSILVIDKLAKKDAKEIHAALTSAA